MLSRLDVPRGGVVDSVILWGQQGHQPGGNRPINGCREPVTSGGNDGWRVERDFDPLMIDDDLDLRPIVDGDDALGAAAPALQRAGGRCWESGSPRPHREPPQDGLEASQADGDLEEEGRVEIGIEDARREEALAGNSIRERRRYVSVQVRPCLSAPCVRQLRQVPAWPVCSHRVLSERRQRQRWLAASSVCGPPVSSPRPTRPPKRASSADLFAARVE